MFSKDFDYATILNMQSSMAAELTPSLAFKRGSIVGQGLLHTVGETDIENFGFSFVGNLLHRFTVYYFCGLFLT